MTCLLHICQPYRRENIWGERDVYRILKHLRRERVIPVPLASSVTFESAQVAAEHGGSSSRALSD